MESFPVAGTRQARLPSYSAIWFDWHDHGDTAIVRLTPVAGLLLPKFYPVADSYARIIRFAAERVMTAAPGAGAMQLTSTELYPLFNETQRLFIPHFPDMVTHEPVNLYQQIGVPDGWNADNAQELAGQWRMVLSENLAKFDGIASLEEYVKVISRAITKDHLSGFAVKGSFISGSTTTTTQLTHALETPQTPPVSYINPSLIDELVALSPTKWNLRKLVSLLRELNANHVAGHPYACLMLCRALLDYVPPIFGVTKFSEVLNNVANLSVADKRYLKMLSEYRYPADDVLHRQIRSAPDLIDMHYLPSNAAMDAFVRVVIDRIAAGS
jgi:hypothetical protein